MLRDIALKFYKDQAYGIPQKPIENGQHINWRNSYNIDRGHMLQVCFEILQGSILWHSLEAY